MAAQPAQFFCRGVDVIYTAVLQIAQRGVALAPGTAQGDAMDVLGGKSALRVVYRKVFARFGIELPL